MIDGGIHLSLMIGPGLPLPAPAEVIESLDSVQVTSSGQTSGFQLSFKVGKSSSLLNEMLPAGYFDPIITRVIIIATVNGQPSVLMDGVITRQEISPSNEVGKSTFTVTGEDLSRLMDLVEMPFMRYSAMLIIARVYAILAKYLVRRGADRAAAVHPRCRSADRKDPEPDRVLTCRHPPAGAGCGYVFTSSRALAGQQHRLLRA
jgi:hypothetical protein